MLPSLHKFLLERIAVFARPEFTGADLAAFPEADLALWLKAGVLQQISVPEFVWRVCDDGVERELQVVPDGDQFVGVALDPDDWIPPVPLMPIDLRRWRFSPRSFSRAIMEVNDLLEIPFNTPGPFPCLGENDDGPVFLIQPISNQEKLILGCSELAALQHADPATVVLPIPVGVPPAVRQRLARDQITIAVLGQNPAHPLALTVPRKPALPRYMIAFADDEWTFRFEGKTFVLKDMDAVRFLVLLILCQGRELSNLAIWKTVAPPSNPEDLEKLLAAGAANGMEKTDFRSIKDAESRLEDVETALSSARESGNRDLVDRLEEEKKKADDYLRKNRRKDGKPRRTSTIYDTARSTVSRGLKTCWAALESQEKNCALKKHLQTAIVSASQGHRTYNPSPRIDWVTKNIPKNLRNPPMFQP